MFRFINHAFRFRTTPSELSFSNANCYCQSSEKSKEETKNIIQELKETKKNMLAGPLKNLPPDTSKIIMDKIDAAIQLVEKKLDKMGKRCL